MSLFLVSFYKLSNLFSIFLLILHPQLKENIYLSIYYLLSVCVCRGGGGKWLTCCDTHTMGHLWRPESLFSSSTMWVLGIKFVSSDLAARAITHSAFHWPNLTILIRTLSWAMLTSDLNTTWKLEHFIMTPSFEFSHYLLSSILPLLYTHLTHSMHCLDYYF